MKEIENIITEKIRPYLNSHEGDIELLGVQEGVVRIKLLGKCKGCPSAQITVEEIVEKELKDEIPDIKRVVVENQYSQELLDMAKKLLNKQK